MDFFAQFKKDQYAAHSGIELVEISDGHAVARMTLQPYHFNSVKVVHGGAVFTLADFAFAAACNSHGTVTLAINVSISLLRAVSDPTEVLTAVAEEVDLNPKISTCEVRVTNKAGELVALFHGQAYRKKDALDNYEPRRKDEG